jgi:hypothetical protein
MMRFGRGAIVVGALALGALLPLGASAPAVAQEAACPVTQAVQQLSGTGDTVTQAISVPAGLLTFTGTYQGSDNFIVWAYGVDGFQDLIFNEIGSYDGQQLIALDEPATLIFEVTAGAGTWQLDLNVIQ